MLAIRKLRSIHWTGLRLLAALVFAVGLWGTVSGLTGVDSELKEALAAVKSGGVGTTVPNPVVGTNQRRHAALLDNQVKDYRGNLATVAAFSVFVTLVTIHFVGLAWRMLPSSPLSSLLGGLFLSASGICGFLLGLDVLKVNEFAFQAVGAQPAEREWLQGGMAFLNQLHLIFVSGWLLFLALGWVALGLGAMRMARGYRWSGCGVLLGAVMLLASIVARYWLPTYGASAPAGVLLLAGKGFSLGISTGLIGSGLIGWMLEGAGDEARRPAAVVEQSAKPSEAIQPSAAKHAAGDA